MKDKIYILLCWSRKNYCKIYWMVYFSQVLISLMVFDYIYDNCFEYINDEILSILIFIVYHLLILVFNSCLGQLFFKYKIHFSL